MGRCHRFVGLLLLACGLSACSDGTGPTTAPSPSASATAPVVAGTAGTSPAGPSVAFTAPTIVQAMSCTGSRLAWVGTDPQQQSVVWTARTNGSGLATVDRAKHGLGIQNTVVAGDWVVFLESKTEAQNPRGIAWYLEAVNATSRAHVDIAGSDSATGVELPQVSTTGETVVWDQLLDGGQKVVFTYDLASRVKKQVPLPPSTYPVRPYIVGTQLVFLDNGADHSAHRDQVPWLFRTGIVTLFDLSSNQLTPLATPVAAYYLEVAGSVATYIVRQANSSDSTLYRVDLRPGATPVTVGPGDTPMYRSASGILASSVGTHMVEYRFDGGSSAELPSIVNYEFTMAPCGNDLYFVSGSPQVYRLPL